MLTFYYGSGSPFIWRVWLALEHKQIGYDPKLLSFQADDLKKPDFLKLNPRHRVPVIVDNDFVLYESAAIVEYLEERFPERALFPSSIRARALTRRMICETDFYVYEPYEMLVRELFFKSSPADWNLSFVMKGRDLLLKEIEHTEKELSGDWMIEEGMTAADLALYPFYASFQRFEKRKPDLGLVSSFGPKVKKWMQRIEQLPYFPITYPAHWK